MINLQGISYDNLTFWSLNLSVALSRFIMNMRLCRNIKEMYNTHAETLFNLTDKYLTAQRYRS